MKLIDYKAELNLILQRQRLYRKMVLLSYVLTACFTTLTWYFATSQHHATLVRPCARATMGCLVGLFVFIRLRK